MEKGEEPDNGSPSRPRSREEDARGEEEVVLDVAAALEQVGGFGPGQWCVIAVLGCGWMLMAATFALPVFLAAPPERVFLSCPISGTGNCSVGATVVEGTWCEEALRGAWAYSRKDELVTAEWDIICDRSLLSASVGSSFFFGVLGGNALLGPLPDHLGRSRTIVATCALVCVGAMVCAEARSFSMYLAGRVFAGFGFGGLGSSVWIMASEVVDKASTSKVMLIMNAMWASGIMLLVLLALALPAWRALSKALALACLGLLALGSMFWLQGVESPQWLAAKGHASDFHRVMDWLSRKNRRSYCPSTAPSNPASGKVGQQVGQQAMEDEPDRCVDVVCRWPVSCWTARFVVAFCACSLGYYGLSLNTGNLGGDVHVSTFLSALVEFPAVLTATRLSTLPRVGRRGTVLGGIALAGVSCLLSALLPPRTALSTALAIVGKLCITVAFPAVVLQSGEAYPAAMRGLAMSIFNCCARVTGILAPVVVMAPAPWPLFVVGSSLLLACLPLRGLPETLGRPPPSTVAEACAGADRSAGGCCKPRYAELEEELPAPAVASSSAAVPQPPANGAVASPAVLGRAQGGLDALS